MKGFRISALATREMAKFSAVLFALAISGLAFVFSNAYAAKTPVSGLSLNTASSCNAQATGSEVSGQNDRVFFVGCAGFF